MTQLTSEWGGKTGLNKHLIATFFSLDKDNIPQSIHVLAPLTEASMEVSLNWQSPFENAGAETKAPALMAMLQSGSLQPLFTGVKSLLPGGGGGQANAEEAAKNRSEENALLRQFEGRTGMTKLNSTQVFTGMPPVKISVTALFRAWENPDKEVEAPFEQLMQWALPEQLSVDGTPLVQATKALNGEKVGFVELLMPSRAPIKVGMRYKNRTYLPLVIESISFPMGSPIDRSGKFTELLVPMTLCTLTALDRQDWTNTRVVSL